MGESLPAKQEICGDNLDNNCDGQTDEGCGVCTSGQTRPCYTGPMNTRGVGVCKDGTETCVGGQWVACAGEVQPNGQEICGNNKDDNCNGKVDEDCFGPIPYGGNCTQSNPTLRCQVGLVCLTFSGDTTGICSRQCNTSSCPSGSRCETINTTTGDRACFVNCTTNANCLSTQNCDSRISACYPVTPRNCRVSDPLGACSSDSECCPGQTCVASGLGRNCESCTSSADCPKIGGIVPTTCCTQTITGQTRRFCATTCP